MMYWYGGWTWLLMIPMMFAMWVLIALVVMPWLRSGRVRPGRQSIDSMTDSPPAR